MRAERIDRVAADLALAAKVAFLAGPSAYPGRPDRIDCRETHMSWIFIAADTVYKLKKPVRFSFLDFSTIDRREAACRAELLVNRRLAGSVYRGIVPLVLSPQGMAIGGEGTPVDWLVVMRRLDEGESLDRGMIDSAIDVRKLDRLADVLADFYRHAETVRMTEGAYLGEWRRRLSDNRRVLFDPRFKLDFAKLAAIDRAQRRFLAECAALLAARASRIVDGHGDLRPEHIFVGDPIAIIDRLEFNRRFRTVDPMDELASLAIECELRGCGWIGERIGGRVGRRLHEQASPALSAFYRCYRATLRARLVIAHLLEPDGRTPGRWSDLAKAYLAIARVEAHTVSSFLDRLRRHRALLGDGSVLLQGENENAFQGSLRGRPQAR